MSIGKGLRACPAPDYSAALAMFDALASRDGPEISPTGRSRLYAHGHTTGRAVVLLHGLTNAPEQWVPFAEQLAARGDTVICPRFPGHGFADRKTRTIARVTSDEFLAVAGEAVDIACGLGDRVTLAGLSIGGAIAAWFSFARPDIARSLAIVPFFGVARLNEAANRVLTTALATLPNLFVPWDPGGDQSQIPSYGYAAFPTHALAACLSIGLDALKLSRSSVPNGLLELTLNAREPACNNALAYKLATAATARRSGSVRTLVWGDVPAIHDIIDPTNPHARTDIVYPRLQSIIDGRFDEARDVI